ncbi:MAG: EpsG family protein, partial [Dokdonella sp.]|nr:EpsG family protein [Dokdonella sp.]
SIFLLALRPLLANRTASVLGYSIVAAGFHLTGLLIPVAYAVHRLSRRRDFDLRYVLLVGTVVFGAIGLSGLGSRLFFSIFEYKLETYSELFSERTSLPNVLWRLLLASMLLVSARATPASHALRQLLLIYLVGFFIYLALADFNMLATRFNMFFRVLEVILIPWTLAGLPRWPRLSMHALYCGLLVAALLIVAMDPDYAYHSILAHVNS